MKKRQTRGRKGGKARSKGMGKSVKSALKKGVDNMKKVLDFDDKK